MGFRTEKIYLNDFINLSSYLIFTSFHLAINTVSCLVYALPYRVKDYHSKYMIHLKRSSKQQDITKVFHIDQINIIGSVVDQIHISGSVTLS